MVIAGVPVDFILFALTLLGVALFHHHTLAVAFAGLGVIITHCCNNYGPRQLPEKLVPLMIANAAAGLSLPVYGEGKQVREWLHARDHAEGLWLALIRGRPFETYNFGGSEERTNLALVEQLAALVDARLGRDPSVGRSLISFVPDRKGHDFRYAIDSSKAQRELAWTEKYRLETELESTVRWYLENAAWRDTVRSAEHERFQAAYYAGAKGERK